MNCEQMALTIKECIINIEQSLFLNDAQKMNLLESIHRMKANKPNDPNETLYRMCFLVKNVFLSISYDTGKFLRPPAKLSTTTGIRIQIIIYESAYSIVKTIHCDLGTTQIQLYETQMLSLDVFLHEIPIKGGKNCITVGNGTGQALSGNGTGQALSGNGTGQALSGNGTDHSLIDEELKTSINFKKVIGRGKQFYYDTVEETYTHLKLISEKIKSITIDEMIVQQMVDFIKFYLDTITCNVNRIKIENAQQLLNLIYGHL